MMHMSKHQRQKKSKKKEPSFTFMKEASTCIMQQEVGGLENFLHTDSITVWLRNRMWFPTTFGSSDNCGREEERNTFKAPGLHKADRQTWRDTFSPSTYQRRVLGWSDFIFSHMHLPIYITLKIKKEKSEAHFTHPPRFILCTLTEKRVNSGGFIMSET